MVSWSWRSGGRARFPSALLSIAVRHIASRALTVSEWRGTGKSLWTPLRTESQITVFICIDLQKRCLQVGFTRQKRVSSGQILRMPIILCALGRARFVDAPTYSVFSETRSGYRFMILNSEDHKSIARPSFRKKWVPWVTFWERIIFQRTLGYLILVVAKFYVRNEEISTIRFKEKYSTKSKVFGSDTMWQRNFSRNSELIRSEHFKNGFHSALLTTVFKIKCLEIH